MRVYGNKADNGQNKQPNIVVNELNTKVHNLNVVAITALGSVMYFLTSILKDLKYLEQIISTYGNLMSKMN